LPEDTSSEYLLEVAAFLVMSARGVIEEGFLYGPFRLVDAVGRLAELPRHAPCIKEDAFLTQVKKEIEEKKGTLMESEEKFVEFLDELVARSSLEN